MDLRTRLAVLMSVFLVGVVTIAVFSLVYRRRQKDVVRTRNGTVLTAVFFREYFFFITFPFLRFFQLTGLKPNIISGIALLLGIAAGFLAWQGWLFEAGWALIFSGMVDTIDGQIARMSDEVTQRGAYLDSVFDRYADLAVFVGLILYFAEIPPGQWRIHPHWYLAATCGAVTAGSLISYVKERGANLGAMDDRGLMQRADRMLITCVMFVYDPAARLLCQVFLGDIVNNHYLTLTGLTLMALGGHWSAALRVRRIAAKLSG